MVVINIPSRLDLIGTLAFAKDLKSVPEFEDVTLNFGDVNWVQPFGMLYAAQTIKRFIEEHPDVSVISTGVDTNKAAVGYAANVGFFRAWSVENQHLPVLARLCASGGITKGVRKAF